MILLDTNVVSELMKARPDFAVLEWIDRQKRSDLFVTVITQAEILLGIALLPSGHRKERLASAADAMFREDFHGAIPSFDPGAASHYATLVAHRTRKGLPIGTEDAQIAAIALQYKLLLVTRNVKDCHGIEGISLLDPWNLTKP